MVKRFARMSRTSSRPHTRPTSPFSRPHTESPSPSDPLDPELELEELAGRLHSLVETRKEKAKVQTDKEEVLDTIREGTRKTEEHVRDCFITYDKTQANNIEHVNTSVHAQGHILRKLDETLTIVSKNQIRIKRGIETLLDIEALKEEDSSSSSSSSSAGDFTEIAVDKAKDKAQVNNQCFKGKSCCCCCTIVISILFWIFWLLLVVLYIYVHIYRQNEKILNK